MSTFRSKTYPNKFARAARKLSKVVVDVLKVTTLIHFHSAGVWSTLLKTDGNLRVTSIVDEISPTINLRNSEEDVKRNACLDLKTYFLPKMAQE